MTEAIWSIIWAGGLLIISQLSPGPDFFLVVRTALSQGFRGASALAFGITLGLLIQAAVVCLVGTWVVEQSWSCLVLAAAGIWLLHLAFNIMPQRVWAWCSERIGHVRHLGGIGSAGGAGSDGCVGSPATQPEDSRPDAGEGAGSPVAQALEVSEQAPVPKHQLAVQGFLCNILNPKCMLFISGICIGPLNAYGSAYDWFMPALAVALACCSQAGWMLWSGLLQFPPLRRSYCRRAHIIDAVFATLLALCALLLFVPLLQVVSTRIF